MNANIAPKQKMDRKNIPRSFCPVVSDSRLLMILPSRKPPAAPGTATTPFHNMDNNSADDVAVQNNNFSFRLIATHFYHPRLGRDSVFGPVRPCFSLFSVINHTKDPGHVLKEIPPDSVLWDKQNPEHQPHPGSWRTTEASVYAHVDCSNFSCLIICF